MLFSPVAANLITETRWHHSQREIRHSDGSVTLEFTVDGLNEILIWLLSWSGRVKVVAPGELRELYLKSLKKAIALQSNE